MKQKLTINYVKTLKPDSNKIVDHYDTDITGFVLRIRPSGKKSYLLFYRNKEGRKRTHTIGDGIALTATQAREIAQLAYADTKKGIDINMEMRKQKAEQAKAKVNTMLNFLEIQYKPWLLANRRSGLHAYQRLNLCFEVLSKKPLDQITKWDMEKWLKRMQEKNAANATIKNDLGELKAMLNKAVQWGVIESHQLRDYKLPKLVTNQITRYLSEEESIRLHKALNEREQKNKQGRENYNQWLIERDKQPLPEYSGYTDHLMPMVLLALNTGMRRNEIFSLDWEHVNLKQRLITVKADNAKSKRTRYIPINNEAYNVLMKWRKQGVTSRLVFPSEGGKKFTNIYKAWNTLMKNAQIKDFRFHDLRHDFASQLVMKGVDLYTVKELMGHSSINMTERYAHLAPKKLADAVSVLETK